MQFDREKELEDLIHRECRGLPFISAPSTLIPRVRAAIEAAQNPCWWQRPWLAWPLPWQVASVPLFLLALAAVTYGGMFALDWTRGTGVAQHLTGSLAWAAAAWDLVVTMGNAAGILSRTVGVWILGFGFALFFTMYLICLAAGSACYRLVLVKN
jgi:hypothetical protein